MYRDRIPDFANTSTYPECRDSRCRDNECRPYHQIFSQQQIDHSPPSLTLLHVDGPVKRLALSTILICNKKSSLRTKYPGPRMNRSVS